MASSVLISSMVTVFFAVKSEAIPVSNSSMQSNSSRPMARMWHGSRVSYKEYPFFAAITFRTARGNYEPLCGGVFVTPQMVLTAAHCIKDMSQMRVRYGVDESKVTRGNNHQFGIGFDYLVTGVYKHPAYVDRKGLLTKAQSADMALVRLDVPIEQTGFTVHLPEPDEEKKCVDTLETVTLVAMGSSWGRDTGHVLKDTRVRLFRKDCADPYNDIKYRVCAIGEDGGWRVCPGMFS